MATSSTEQAFEEATTAELCRSALNLTAGQRLCLVAAGYVPFLNLIAIVGLVALAARSGWQPWSWLL
ncbi:MAG TPA: hypothetical protein VFV34_04310, partial [Blastocatellia bacterium]|nr:hypothetical protein [Blastocatellia bacterium]